MTETDMNASTQPIGPEDSENHHEHRELTKELTDVFVEQEPGGRVHAEGIGSVGSGWRSKLRG
jgi:hypothetical protein